MHYSVMLNEVIDSLNIKSDGLYVDATLGYAGHSGEILKRIKKGYLFAFDQDIEAIKFSQKKLSEIGTNFLIIKSNFLYLKEKLLENNINKVSGILFDLGVSSPQLDNKERGFSYLQNAKLDMRMDLENKLSAYDVVNFYSKEDLCRIIKNYGEEKYAFNIATNIIKERSKQNIETTFQLVDIIKKSMPYKDTIDKNPARRTFQAIRIEVNKELEILEESLNKALSVLDVGGRVCVITFHSLEEKIVKQVFKNASSLDPVLASLPDIPLKYLPKFKIIASKILPTDKELKENRRSRSSKLHIIERIRED